MAVFVEALSEPAAFTESVHVVLKLGDDAAEVGNLGGERAVDDCRQRRDGGCEGDEDHQDPFGRDCHGVVVGDFVKASSMSVSVTASDGREGTTAAAVSCAVRVMGGWERMLRGNRDRPG